jgi:hypothetical protein
MVLLPHDVAEKMESQKIKPNFVHFSKDTSPYKRKPFETYLCTVYIEQNTGGIVYDPVRSEIRTIDCYLC